MAVYKFVECKNVQFKTTLTGRKFDSKWLTIEPDGTFTVYSNNAGYAWDGCSPKYRCLDLLLGTPDGAIDEESKKPITYYASMLHDAIYQFKEEIPVTRKEADLLFYAILKKKNFFWKKVYYRCVRLFGGLYGNWAYSKRCYFKDQLPLSLDSFEVKSII